MSSATYTFDSSKIELVGGVARLRVPQTSGTILINQLFGVKTFTSLTETVNKSGSDDIQYQMKVSGVLKYWNGSAWVSSDGSFTQSNSVSTINTNAATLITTVNKTLQVQAILKGSGSTSPELDQLIVTFENGPVFSTVSGECTVYCYLRDILGDDLTVSGNSPKLIAVNDAPFVNRGVVVPRFYRSVDFASTSVGLLASISLAQTDISNNKIRFIVTYLPYGITSKAETVHLRAAVIPNQNEIDLCDLSSIDSSQLI